MLPSLQGSALSEQQNLVRLKAGYGAENHGGKLTDKQKKGRFGAEKHGGKLTDKQKKARKMNNFGAEKHGGKLTDDQLNGKIEGGRGHGLGQLTVYQCYYCNAKKESKSTSSDELVRMRCGCGGKQRDNAVRMHSKWIKPV